MTFSRKPLSTARLIHLNAAWFGLAFLWNGLHIIILPLILVDLAPPGLKSTYLGGLTFAGLFLATLVQPLAGAVSDRSGWLGRFGKRRPWMVLGVTIDIVFLTLLFLADDFLLLLAAYAGLQIASNLVEATLQSLLPDLVPAEQRGRGAGYKNAAQIAGFVAGVGLAGALAGRGHLAWALVAAGLALLLTTSWTLFGAPEPPFRPVRKQRALSKATLTGLLRSLHLKNAAAPGYLRLLAGRALLMAGFFSLQSFAQYFVADVLRAENPAGTTSAMMAVMGAAVFLVAVPTGVLADRIGRKPINLLAGFLGVIATVGLIFVGNITQLMVAGGLVGVSVGIFMSANWAWAADLAPPQEAGRYLGLGNLATAGSSAFARLFAGPIVDAGNAMQVGLGYHILFFILAIGMAVGVYLLAAVPETRPVGGKTVPLTTSPENSGDTL